MSRTAIMQFEVANRVLQMNLEGITHEESLVGPSAGGNCLNWVVGHLVSAYNNLLTGIGGESVWDDDRQALYDRASEPIAADRAVRFEELVADFASAHRRVVEAVAALGPDQLAAPAPYSPASNPDETVGSLIELLAFHQSYHTGQTGLLRRVAGRPGAVR